MSESSDGLHPRIAAAARGRLPPWSEVRPDRRAHLASVAGLLRSWAGLLDLPETDRARWAAAGWLHDALRDAEPAALAGEAGDYPPPLRHGPATAARLRSEGVSDAELLEAIAFHTTGKPGLGRPGRFLYMADYLDPTRRFDPAGRAALRARLPAAEWTVLREVCARRLRWLLQRGTPVLRETIAFWNELAEAG